MSYFNLLDMTELEICLVDVFGTYGIHPSGRPCQRRICLARGFCEDDLVEPGELRLLHLVFSTLGVIASIT